MNARQLERLLVQHGAPASFLDVVTRKLREAMRLPKGGRGLNAPEIGGDEAAWTLLGLAGTDTATQAAHAITRLLELRLPAGIEPRHSREFVSAVQIILGSVEWAGEISEVRVGRSCPHSQIIYRDGHVEHFVLPDVSAHAAASVGSARFRSEGVLSGGLLHQVAIDLSGVNDLAGLNG